MPSDEKTRKAELDAFWNIDDIIPKSRGTGSFSSREDTDVVEIVSESAAKRQDNVEVYSDGKLTQKFDPVTSIEKNTGNGTVIKRFIPPHTPESEKKPAPEFSYSPEDSLIHNVRIYKWSSSYNYYERFCREASSFSEREGKKCEFVPFFSYVPQYDQLSPEQLDYYLWWRTCARKGEYIKTDYSYILLYIYEILNLGNTSDTLEGQKQLCGIAGAYVSKYERIGRLLADWICDYSLIYRLPPPPDTTTQMHGFFSASVLKEFYIPASVGNIDSLAPALMAFCSSYDYRKSKFAVGENRKIFDKYIPAALTAALHSLTDDGKILGKVPYGDSTMTREAFSGALCSYRIKKRIEVDYLSFSRSHELRFLVGDIIKYAENKIRASLGIKSRLSIYSVPAEICQVVDHFLDESLPKNRRQTAKDERHEYDDLYDIKKEPLSLSNAAKIEKESWETTKNLVEAFENGDNEVHGVKEYESGLTSCEADIQKKGEENAARNSIPDTVIYKAGGADEYSGDNGIAAAFGEYLGFIYAVIENDFGRQKKIAAEMSRMPETVVDAINTVSVDVIGDILIDGDIGEWYVIDDYKSYFEKGGK